MQQQNFEAVFENGVLRPLANLQLREGQSVKLTVENDSTLTPEEMLQLAAQVYEGLSEQDIEEIEQIACKRSDFFSLNIAK